LFWSLQLWAYLNPPQDLIFKHNICMHLKLDMANRN
jgi:hypothetical protein